MKSLLKVRNGLAALVMAGMLWGFAACGSADISGTWKVTDGSYGQASPGAVIILLSNGKCSLYSPSDTCTYSNGTLSGTGLMGGNYSFKVTVVDSNHIKLEGSGTTISLSRG